MIASPFVYFDTGTIPLANGAIAGRSAMEFVLEWGELAVLFTYFKNLLDPIDPKNHLLFPKVTF
ncbi:hypothetical protein [Larkinella humicola]|uniref:Uncharacterized protein n=1 Tax=Larkinella humicola TaxID=2607654 RepID=A0A5N1J987_9BACT|nr:hypothetical protein [Larkinella humicola]KAA9349015.1 hypothetical protein F0P93_21660 [Larkinella humicola]